MAILDFNSNTAKIKLKLGVYDNVNQTFTPVSSVLNLRYDQECSNYNIHLTWLNNLGNWEHFVFKAEKAFETQFEDSKQARRSNFDNWDTDFTQAETQDFYYDIKAFESLVVTTQMLTEEDAKAVKTIKESIQVQQILPDLTKRTVLVDKDAFTYYTDNEKLTQFSFTIRYSDEIPIQNQ